MTKDGLVRTITAEVSHGPVILICDVPTPQYQPPFTISRTITYSHVGITIVFATNLKRVCRAGG